MTIKITDLSEEDQKHIAEEEITLEEFLEDSNEYFMCEASAEWCRWEDLSRECKSRGYLVHIDFEDEFIEDLDFDPVKEWGTYGAHHG